MHMVHIIPAGSEADDIAVVNQELQSLRDSHDTAGGFKRLITRGAYHVKNNCYQKQCCCSVNEHVHDHEMMTQVKEEVPVRWDESLWNQVSKRACSLDS